MTDLHTRWSHRWLNPKAEARSSTIEGTGVFAKQEIMNGERVGVLGGVIIPVAEIEEYWTQMGHVGIQIDEGFFIVPTNREELEAKGVFNHSCDPNLGFVNSITLAAIRDVQAGEELVFDYAMCESLPYEMQCNCGSANCRKNITGDDWKVKEIQEKYGKHYSPYLKDKIG